MSLEAVEALVWGDVSDRREASQAWLCQGFEFFPEKPQFFVQVQPTTVFKSPRRAYDRPPQHKNGPCGVLAAVQAQFISEALFPGMPGPVVHLERLGPEEAQELLARLVTTRRPHSAAPPNARPQGARHVHQPRLCRWARRACGAGARRHRRGGWPRQ